VIRFITEQKDHQEPGPDGAAGFTSGVEPMCAVLCVDSVTAWGRRYLRLADLPTCSRDRVVHTRHTLRLMRPEGSISA
jgi:hypothetical protein